MIVETDHLENCLTVCNTSCLITLEIYQEDGGVNRRVILVGPDQYVRRVLNLDPRSAKSSG